MKPDADLIYDQWRDGEPAIVKAVEAATPTYHLEAQ